MARNVREAAGGLGRDCRIAMDLPGPKLRTGPLVPGPAVLRLRPARDALGRMIAPATVAVVPAYGPTGASGEPVVELPRDWLARRRDGELLQLRDARGRHRHLQLHRGTNGPVVTTNQTTYLTPGMLLHPTDDAPAAVGPLPVTEQTLLLRPGDLLTLTRDCHPTDPATEPDCIGCTLPEVFDHAQPGQQAHFDDGRISGVIERVEPERIEVRITRAKPHGSRLHAGRGINLPDTDIPIPALTASDRAALTTVVAIADIVGLSFVRTPADVDDLLRELDSLGDDHVGVLLKIETAAAFRHLPEILLTAMRRPRVGVMIARGDLAVECGYQRLAELQEEILWVCEAAHLPVIWATQVLEQLAKKGQPSRAEITDAAMGDRAECVMLNKGPFIDEAVTVLDDVLHRMRRHQYKKVPLLHPLTSWQPDPAGPPTATPRAGGPAPDNRLRAAPHADLGRACARA
jgi:pyruvate kinase